ncbi:MAG TPA: phospholipase D-like domain-containing protein [Streptosporangiaceae bacterium]|jgi:phosphatidylserine/phosphatidylglycerophosphate/cardiolipin synthase-like enzyme|nr:phospholipase D-like domain-containing protein [Streptosporangiaceae bacterium]
MSTSLTGKLINDSGVPLPGLTVVVADESACTDLTLGSADSQSDGTFSVSYVGDLTVTSFGARTLGIRVFTQAHRQLLYQTRPDSGTAPISLGDLQIAQTEVTGWTVTLGGKGAALPVRDGNGIVPLIDDHDAWQHIADSMNGAQSVINVMQLEFDMPSNYVADDTKEKPEVVISFGDPFDPATGRVVDSTHGDFRPERILLAKAQAGLTVRIMMPVVGLTWATAPFLLILLLPLWMVLLFRRVAGAFHYVQKYFGQVTGTVPQLHGFDVSLYNRVHAKLVMVDDSEVTVVSSPFNQSYWDDGEHLGYDAHRGTASQEHIPIHDVSAAVTGPAVKDMHDAFILHWNLGQPQAQQIAPIDLPAPITTAPDGGSIASLQLVRTIKPGVFPGLPDGEQGVLELYLRAIESAKQYIYLENQYFTNETIAAALIAALNDKSRSTLQIICLFDVEPDTPCYTGWQAGLIKNIRNKAGDNASRIGFFTAWTHNAPVPSPPAKKVNPNPIILPNYVHSKFAIVDGTWATVGSANLDGASLDSCQVLQAIQFGVNRNHELNYGVFSGIDGHPTTDFIDNIRRAMWGEHLGLDPSDPQLASGGSNDNDWLTLWQNQAKAKQSGLVTDPGTIDPSLGRVLQYPDPPAKSPKKFLTALGISLTSLTLVEKERPFNFATGAWS